MERRISFKKTFCVTLVFLFALTSFMVGCADSDQPTYHAVAKVDISDIEPENGYVKLDSAVEDYDEVMVTNPYSIDDDLLERKIKQKVKGFEYNDFAIVIFIKDDEAVVFAEAKGELSEYLRKYNYSDTGKLYPRGYKFYK